LGVGPPSKEIRGFCPRQRGTRLDTAGRRLFRECSLSRVHSEASYLDPSRPHTPLKGEFHTARSGLERGNAALVAPPAKPYRRHYFWCSNDPGQSTPPKTWGSRSQEKPKLSRCHRSDSSTR